MFLTGSAGSVYQLPARWVRVEGLRMSSRREHVLDQRGKNFIYLLVKSFAVQASQRAIIVGETNVGVMYAVGY